MTVPTTETLIIQRTLKAAPDVVFAAFSTIDAMKKWMGPGECSMTEGEMAFRVGGDYRWVMQTDKGPATVAGSYREISPPSKLVFAWRWLGENEAAFEHSVVTIELASVEEGTALTLTHQGLPSVEAKDHHRQGWDGCFEKLVALYT